MRDKLMDYILVAFDDNLEYVKAWIFLFIVKRMNK